MHSCINCYLFMTFYYSKILLAVGSMTKIKKISYLAKIKHIGFIDAPHEYLNIYSYIINIQLLLLS